MFDDIARTAEKIIMELNEKDNEKFAIDFAQKLTDAGVKVEKIYGPSVGPVNIFRTEFRGVQLDFSERDKKVMESAQKYIDKLKTENEALRKQVENLDKQNTDITNYHMKLQNDSKDEIQVLETEIQRLREKCGEVPIDTDKACVSGFGTDYELLCRKLQDQHQQDCIRINDLTTTINVLSGLYANLRKNVGMD